MIDVARPSVAELFQLWESSLITGAQLREAIGIPDACDDTTQEALDEGAEIVAELKADLAEKRAEIERLVNRANVEYVKGWDDGFKTGQTAPHPRVAPRWTLPNSITVTAPKTDTYTMNT